MKSLKSQINWAEIDWTRDNETIAKELNRAYNTVAKKRVELGKSGLATTRKTRKDKGLKNPKRSLGAINQPLATKAAKSSPKSGKCETNVHAKWWRLISSDGQAFKIRNLYQFVRDNPHLFTPKDVEWKRTGGKRGTGGEYCNATAGLLNIIGGKAKKWKGWIIKQTKPE